MTWNDRQARDHVVRTETLLTSLSALPDPAARDRAIEAAQALVALYGECLARVMALAGTDLTRAAADDELIGHLLLVHGLHPDPADTRIRTALDGLRGLGDAELVALDGQFARIRVRSRGCGSSGEALRTAVQEAVARAAPEIERVEIEEAAATVEPPLIPVEALSRGGARAGGAHS
ncbi:NifU family protein [Streptomyces sp. NPDC021749]|uniref:NifU family protein n=1 Tax=Streptomyces sp. NPDC021749 TaxID=3154905 RepID=UPI0033D83764